MSSDALINLQQVKRPGRMTLETPLEFELGRMELEEIVGIINKVKKMNA